jgi:hypothetical protein
VVKVFRRYRSVRPGASRWRKGEYDGSGGWRLIDSMCLASFMRPEEPAPKGQKSLAQGLPRVGIK